MSKKLQNKTATPEGKVRYAHVENFQGVVYNDFMGVPLKVTFLNDRWWVTTEGERLQPLADYFDGEDVEFSFLCEAGGRVDTLALARVLGKALEEPEDNVLPTMARRVMCLKRLGVELDVESETLEIDIMVFGHGKNSLRKGAYSVACSAAYDPLDILFDIDGFSNKRDAKEYAKNYTKFLRCMGINVKVLNFIIK